MSLTTRHTSAIQSRVGWLRLVGSLKLQVSFAKEPYKREDILQKRPIIWRSLLIVATLYTYSPLFTGSWNMQEDLDSTIFWAGGSRFCEGPAILCFLRHEFKLAILFIAHLKCISWDASFELIQNLATLHPKKLQGPVGLQPENTPTPLLHPREREIERMDRHCTVWGGYD